MLEEFFSDRKTDDLLLLYFSGHGIKDIDGRLYFAMRNTKLDRLLSTAIPANFINELMRKSRSRKQILILDCCNSGAFARGMAVRSGEKVGTGEYFRKGQGHVVITASDAVQYAFEGGDVKGKGIPSVFTKTIIDGLRSGEADKDFDGLVSFDDLYDYVYDLVTHKMPQQEPQKWTFDAKGTLIIAKNPRPIAKPLPADLQEAIKSPYPSIRSGAVKELESLLNGNDRGQSLAARQTLEKLTQDDSRSVSEAAKLALRDMGVPEVGSHQIQRTMIVISDLHLSAGLNEETGLNSQEEDFLFDNEFKRFLEYLQKNPGRNHLIINGDMFDFLQVSGDFASKLEKEGKVKIDKGERNYGFGTEPDKTVLKLQRIRDGHKTFFEALSDFLSKGNELSIISGNHDIELFWDEVSEELVNILSCNDNSVRDKIKFYPWFYYDKENKIYIEHGNQYDNWNSFKFILNPVIPSQKDKKILLPLGSFFIRYFFNKIEDTTPFADNIKPSSRYMEWAFKNNPIKSLRLLKLYIRTMSKTFWRSGGFSKAQEAELIKEAEPRFNAIIQETGLSRETLDKLNSKMIPPVTRSKLAFLINFGWIGTIFLFVIIMIVAFFIKQVFNLSIWSLLSAYLAFLPLLLNWLISKFRRDQTGKILKEIKKEILKEVKIIVMGHTHDPVIEKIDDDCWYYNTGTWTTIFSEEDVLIRKEKQFALLKIKLTDRNLNTQLMRWNDAAKECERLNLF